MKKIFIIIVIVLVGFLVWFFGLRSGIAPDSIDNGNDGVSATSSENITTEEPTQENTSPEAVDQELQGINLDDIQSELDGIDENLKGL